jgi:hypothetical protein
MLLAEFENDGRCCRGSVSLALSLSFRLVGTAVVVGELGAERSEFEKS